MQTKKNDQNKTDLSIIDNQFVHGICKILMFGAEKYERDNWRLGTQYSRTFSACKRHLDAWWDGENNDPETGLSHLYHAACNLMFLDYWQRYGRGEDNRYNEIIKHECLTNDCCTIKETKSGRKFNDGDIVDLYDDGDYYKYINGVFKPLNKPPVSPECAGQDCDFCDDIRESIEDIKAGRILTHEEVWSGDCPLTTLSGLVEDEIKSREDNCDRCGLKATAYIGSDKFCIEHLKRYIDNPTRKLMDRMSDLLWDAGLFDEPIGDELMDKFDDAIVIKEKLGYFD